MLILLVLFLVGAAINVPIAVQFLKSRTQMARVPMTRDLTGVDAAKLGWPTATPHETDWPAPDRRTLHPAFGYRRIQVRVSPAEPGINGHTMEYELMGWPLPVLERVQMWWPWDHPTWKTTAEPDPALRLHWTGLILNPLIFAFVAWIVLFAWVDVARSIIRRHRRSRQRCEECGYMLDPESTTDRCPECGVAVPETV